MMRRKVAGTIDEFMNTTIENTKSKKSIKKRVDLKCRS